MITLVNVGSKHDDALLATADVHLLQPVVEVGELLLVEAICELAN